MYHDSKDLRPLETFVSHPEADEIRPENERAASFLAYCLKVKRPGEFAQRRDFTVESLRPWIGYIMILEHLPEMNDFRYRMYGSAIAEQSGFDMTGKLVSDFKSKAGEFFLSLYRDSVEKQAIIFAMNSAVHATFTCDWYRVVCPVRREESIQIVAFNYPQAQKNQSISGRD